MTIFAFETSRPDREHIVKEFNIEERNLSFFPTSTSVFDLLQLNPDLIIQDYEKRAFIKCKEIL